MQMQIREVIAHLIERQISDRKVADQFDSRTGYALLCFWERYCTFSFGPKRSIRCGGPA